MAKKESAEKAVRDIRRKTRRRFSAEEKIRIVIEGLRGEESIASLCRRSAGSVLADVYPRTRTAPRAHRKNGGPGHGHRRVTWVSGSGSPGARSE